MKILIDSNVLIRLTQTSHASHADALAAMHSPRSRGDVPCIVPQIVY